MLMIGEQILTRNLLPKENSTRRFGKIRPKSANESSRHRRRDKAVNPVEHASMAWNEGA